MLIEEIHIGKKYSVHLEIPSSLKISSKMENIYISNGQKNSPVDIYPKAALLKL